MDVTLSSTQGFASPVLLSAGLSGPLPMTRRLGTKVLLQSAATRNGSTGTFFSFGILVAGSDGVGTWVLVVLSISMAPNASYLVACILRSSD